MVAQFALARLHLGWVAHEQKFFTKGAVMDLIFTQEQLEFREEVRAFLTQELSPEVWRAHRDQSEQGMWSEAFTKAFRLNLGAGGYIGMGWSKEHKAFTAVRARCEIC